MVTKKMMVKKLVRKTKEKCKTCGKESVRVLLFKRCPDCRSLRIATLAETGEKYCKACGLVLL